MRWVFKDYFSRHSDLRRHENRFLVLTSAWKPVFIPAYVGTLTEIIFKTPPLGERASLRQHKIDLFVFCGQDGSFEIFARPPGNLG